MGRFAFDANRHEYIDQERGEILPHITGMMQSAGLVDDTWFTEESCIRGTACHRLTADYDLGAIANPHALTTKYKPYLLGHVKAMGIVRPVFTHVEEPIVHNVEGQRFGGRPDRVGLLYSANSVLEGKSGLEDDSHCIQTALQAILVAPELRLPPETIARYCIYWKATGKFKLEHHTNDARDFRKAREIIRRFAA